MKTSLDLLNYGIGVETARNLKNQGVDVNLDLLIQGLKDGLAGERLLVDEKQLRSAVINFQSEIRRKQAVEKQLSLKENAKALK
ncbi:hypothetical protein KI809_17515 [Geobacter pelophilus]|uniref:Peptidyl-prolyl cis-trans isomerase FKBP-type N-terminal domain-containing protein n=1 Tax=Geoanaerobacter pelophilus TaxID=60036 RepID=A0AAW4LDM7_9BACT|nr:FKBP-type peptidyl-prolyl cis-trans isomerase N-terminal domain-containing protein [Geoanaerobacter pelophilus]MBT0666114.1 hypothetical protein [Geoanaerobacter pelophilus]